MIEPNTIYQGNSLDLLKEMPDGMVDCIITSPPYWGLRDYGLEPIVWDAREGNAWGGSLGLEPTFHLYLDHLMQIMAECRRVLKATGCMFVNIGDSYNSHSCGQGNVGGIEGKRKNKQDNQANVHRKFTYPDKCLIGIPERFAIRMTDELGMIRRNTIIWWKRNCMPSSANDRFTVDFEPVYFFVKQGEYWFKQQKEPHLTKNLEYERTKSSKWGNKKATTCKPNVDNYIDNTHAYGEGGRNRRCVWDIPTEPSSEPHFAMFPQKLVEPMLDAGCPPDGIVLDPFSGMATVASVAIRQGKRFIMFEASPEYAGRSQKRIGLEMQQMRLEL